MAIRFRFAISIFLAIFMHQAAGAGGAQSAEDYADKRARTALVIGFAAYPTAPLKNPLADALLVGKKLEAAGFTVDRLVDVTGAQLAAGVDKFKASSRGADIALIYYAGHGLQINSENYMVPVDFDPTAANPLAQLYSVRALLYGLDKTAKARVLLLDACRDNPFGKELKARGAPSQRRRPRGDRASGR